MPTGTITPADITIAGSVDLVTGGQAATATDGDAFVTTGYELAYVYNGSGSPITVTIDAYPSGGQGAPLGLSTTDPTVTVAASALKVIGPFPRTIFGNATNSVKLTCSSVTTVKVGAIRVNPAP